uniref:Glutaredoxin-dependent peroxiredoxin n=1 Tax=Ananas comosus var. bracteatus TaxID=296719 RepID=A0A6V7Q0R2_ANACO|nr:unnamed protein product [Ananas comosus var. bracteatus]
MAAAAAAAKLLSPPPCPSASALRPRPLRSPPLRLRLRLRPPSASPRPPLLPAALGGVGGGAASSASAPLRPGKKAVLFAVPGAFTPTCSQKHLPGFVEKAAELRARGVDAIACVSVNDAFVMRAWKESLSVPDDQVLLLSDGNGDFTRALGVELDLTDKPVGLGVRSRRYAMLVDDGVVKVLNLEDGGAFTTSSAEEILKAL